MALLSKQQLLTLDRLLGERERSLKSAVHEHITRRRENDVPTAGGVSGDLADQADVEQERELENGAVVRDVRELRIIESAHERIAAGQAGVCVDCDEPIGFERLLVQPTALRCVPCQAASEHAELFNASSLTGPGASRP